MHSTAKSLLSLCAADLMTRDIVMIPREMSLPGAARMLARANVTGAPVVDADRRCVGVLSATDFVHWVEKERADSQHRTSPECMCSAWQLPEGAAQPCNCVEECMNKDPVLVQPGTRIGELARMMIDAHIHQPPALLMG